MARLGLLACTISSKIAKLPALSLPSGCLQKSIDLDGPDNRLALALALHGVARVKTKRAAIYVRVSTNDQDTGLQETELREYVESRGWSCTVYRDQGQSGAKSERPALTALMNDLRKRKADVVVVWALDRLARSLKHLLTIAEECRLLGVDLVSLRQNIDTTLPAGRLTFAVLGAVAEFEREMLRERVKAGMAQARRAGKRVGRPALRHFSAQELERMQLLRTQGTSIRKLATFFGTTQWMAARLTNRVAGAAALTTTQ
jgi:DNA invertase Pin-like site-specific DNA recombinase